MGYFIGIEQKSYGLYFHGLYIGNERLLRYYHYEKPHQKDHGTRFHEILRDHLWKSLIYLPERFTLDKYIVITIATLVFLLQRVKSFLSEKLTLMVKLRLMILLISSKTNLMGNMIFTHRKRLVVKQGNKIIKSFSFPN